MEKWKFVASTPGRVSHAARRAEKRLKPRAAKGRAILIEGRLKFDQWEGKDGAKRSKITVVVESFQFMNDRGSDAHQGGNSPRQPQPDAIGNQSHFSPDDIPF